MTYNERNIGKIAEDSKDNRNKKNGRNGEKSLGPAKKKIMTLY